jgi:N6-L-threonylcarbamoyladenine synthase
MRQGAKKTVRVLGIETSCDETSVALLRVHQSTVEIQHHETATQIPIHERYGGVVPEVAARTHVAEVVRLLERADVFSGSAKFDAIAVTRGPGLPTALRVGLEAGRTVAMVTGKTLIGVNHLEGHLASAWLSEENREKWQFPVLALLVSGGHTELVLMKDFCSYRVLGRTRDDAAGEAFDKSAKLMGLGYPGGPAIAKLAAQGDLARAREFRLPRPMLDDPSFDFSFSGLKTAVRNAWLGLPEAERKDPSRSTDLAYATQEAITDVLVHKTLRAVRQTKPRCVTVVGGVSANVFLQQRLAEEVGKLGIEFLFPPKGLHTDNAAMIAAAGAWRFFRGKTDDWKKVEVKPEWDL